MELFLLKLLPPELSDLGQAGDLGSFWERNSEGIQLKDLTYGRSIFLLVQERDTGIFITDSCSINYWGCNGQDQNEAKLASQNTEKPKIPPVSRPSR